MKKILILLATMCCCGCSPTEQNIKYTEWVHTNVGYFTYIEYDGHEYLIWKSRGYAGGIIHSPDCPCKMK